MSVACEWPRNIRATRGRPKNRPIYAQTSRNERGARVYFWRTFTVSGSGGRGADERAFGDSSLAEVRSGTALSSAHLLHFRPLRRCAKRTGCRIPYVYQMRMKILPLYRNSKPTQYIATTAQPYTKGSCDSPRTLKGSTPTILRRLLNAIAG
jgi:hypothetical protein